MNKSFVAETILKFDKDTKALREVSQQVKGLDKNVKGLRGQTKAAFAQVGAYIDKGSARLMSFGKKAMLVGGILVAAFAGGIAKISKMGAELESYEVTLRQLYGDARQAGDAMNWIMGMQVKTPYTPEELLSALKPLKVFGMDAKKWLPAIGDMASTMGKDITDAATGVAKAFSAGQAGADALRESYGVTMANLVKISGYTEQELRKDMNKYRDALYQFITDPKFKGGMARYAATWKGVLSSIKGGMQTFLMYTGRAINNVMKEDFKKVVDWVVGAYESGKLEEWAKRVAEGFKKIWQGLKKAGAVIWKFIKPIVNFFKEHPNMLKWAIAATAAGSAFTLLGGGASFVLGKIGKLSMGLIRGVGQLKKFGGAARNLFTTLKAGGGIAGMLSGKGGLLGGIGQMAGGLGGKLAAKGGLLGKLGGLLGGGAGAGGAAAAGGGILGLGSAIPIIGGVVAAIGLFATSWKKNFAGIREATKEAFAPLFGKGEKVKTLGQAVKKIWGFVKKLWESLAKALAPVFKVVMKIIGVVIRIGKAFWKVRQSISKIFGGETFGLLKLVGKLLEWVFGIIAKGIEFVLKPLEKAADWLASFLGVFTDEPQKKLIAINEEVQALLEKKRKSSSLTEAETARLKELKAEYVKTREELNKFPKIRQWWGKTKQDFKKGWEEVRVNTRFSFGLMKLVGERFFGKLKEGWAKMKENAAKTWAAIGEKAKKLWEGIKNVFKKAWDWLDEHFFQKFKVAFDWLRDKVFKPIGKFFDKFMIQPFRDAIALIKEAIGKLGTGIGKFLGISEKDLQELKKWAEAKPVRKKKAGGAGEAGAGETEPAPDELAAAGLGGGGGAGGGGGPSIHYHTTHNHFDRGAIEIITGADEGTLKRVLIDVLGKEATANA